MKLIRLAVIAAGILSSISSYAAAPDSIWHDTDADHLLSLDADARLDWQLADRSGKTDRSQTGFMGKYIALKAHGSLTEGLTYTWRQRFSRTPKDASFWDQTDILDLDYRIGKWNVGAGKQVVMIGGYEYNRAPIDLMCPNLFVTNVACYQYGVSGGYQLTDNDHLSFQITQSLFANPEDRNLYAYNLLWRSGRPINDLMRIETIWSVNEIEYERGRFCNYVALGNKLVIGNEYVVLLDLMTRSYPDNNPFKNNTFMCEFSWLANRQWTVSGKVSYDCNMGVNRTKKTEIARGSELLIFGGVAEWYPLLKARHTLKAHAALFYSIGKNLNTSDLMQKNTFYASVGLTWHMNLLNVR